MKLGQVLRRWRLMSEMDLRTAAALMGTEASTLLRIEQGRSPSASTLRSILMWMLEDQNGDN